MSDAPGQGVSQTQVTGTGGGVGFPGITSFRLRGECGWTAHRIIVLIVLVMADFGESWEESGRLLVGGVGFELSL